MGIWLYKTPILGILLGKGVGMLRRILIDLVLSFSLCVNFLKRLVETKSDIFPNTSSLTIGMNTLPPSLSFLNDLNNVLSTKSATIIILILTFLVFVYELGALVRKILTKNKKEHIPL